MKVRSSSNDGWLSTKSRFENVDINRVQSVSNSGLTPKPAPDNGIVSSKFRDRVPHIDLWNMIRPTIEQNGDRTAVRELMDNGRSLTFRELRVWSEAIVDQFYQHGLHTYRNARLAIYSPNCIEYVLVFLAAQRLGLTFVTVNYMQTAEELHHCLGLTDAVALVSAESVLGNAIKAASTISSVQKLFVIGSGSGAIPLIAPRKQRSGIEPHELPTLSASLASEIDKITIDPFTNVALILFSSGTTGLPKAVALSHHNMVAIQTGFKHESAKIDSPYRLVYQPLSHIFGLGVSCESLATGTTLLLQSKFNLHEYLAAACQYKVPVLHCVPPIAAMMAKSDLSRYDLSFLRTVIVASAPLSSMVEAQLRTSVRNPNIIIAQAYGLTETSGIITLTPYGISAQHLRDKYNVANPPPSGSCGMLYVNTEAKVVDVDSGEVLGPNADGEILARGPQIMLGYLNNSSATLATIDCDGWLRTGDIGHYDEDGHFFIVDRAKELIKYNGFQVAPAELEGVIMDHPSVYDVGVIGILDEQAGELPQAWIVRKADAAALTERDITEWVKGRSAPYKWLRGGVRFVENIPRSPTGKILRRLMRQTVANAKL